MASWESQISAVAALDEPTRRRLYDYVVGQPDLVSRDQAAAALAVPHSTAAFHLNRLVDWDYLVPVDRRRHERRAASSSGRYGSDSGSAPAHGTLGEWLVTARQQLRQLFFDAESLAACCIAEAAFVAADAVAATNFLVNSR